MMCVKAMAWPAVIGVLLMWLLALPYWGKCRNFAQLRQGSADPPPPVPPAMAGALAPTVAGSLVSVLASALVPARRPKGRMTESRKQTAAAGPIDVC